MVLMHTGITAELFIGTVKRCRGSDFDVRHDGQVVVRFSLGYRFVVMEFIVEVDGVDWIA
jgi:hypothetical protein